LVLTLQLKATILFFLSSLQNKQLAKATYIDATQQSFSFSLKMMVLQPQQSNFTESVKKKRRIQLDESNLVNPEEDVSGGVGELGAPKPSSEEEYLTHKSLRWYISLGDFKTQVSMKRLLELDGSDMPRKKKKRKAEINDGEDVEVSNDEIEEEDGEENDESDSHGSYYDVDDPFIDDSGIVRLHSD
jgi:hypothetical protein